MDKFIIPTKSIIISCPQLCGRLGNYLFNIAFCTNILFQLNKLSQHSNLKKYLYLNCAGYAHDGHQNNDIYHYKGANTDSYYLSIFKYDQLDENDKISTITNSLNEIELESKPNSELLLKHIITRHRHIFAQNCDHYELFYDSFPIIIELFIYQNTLIIQLNNMIYEGIADMGDFTKNIYLDNNNISSGIINRINQIISKYNNFDFFFIKMDFAIISSHLTFHSESFNKYFALKLFSYKIDNMTAIDYVTNRYNIIKSQFTSKELFVSMHFRGSDYGDPKRQTEWFVVLGPQYYIDCINDICKINSNNKIIYVFFCASDDDEYILNKLIPYICDKIDNHNITPQIILYKQFIKNHEELIVPQLNLYLMGLFDYMCLSNSTYSWWSHYLSKSYLASLKNIYVPLLYQFPENQQVFNSLTCVFLHILERDNVYKNPAKIFINNYIVNVLAWYGYTSSIYVYILFKRFMDLLEQKIMDMKIDVAIFKHYLCNIFDILIKYNLIDDKYLYIKYTL
jgi:hypothetical protein